MHLRTFGLVFFVCCICNACVLWLTSLELHGQPPADPRYDLSPVLARVGTETITQADLDFLAGRGSSGLRPEPLPELAAPPERQPAAQGHPKPQEQLHEQGQLPLSPFVQANAIELWALQRQALETLRHMGQAAEAGEIEAAIRDRALPAQEQWTIDRIVEDVCQRHAIEPEKYRRFIDFRIAWPRYVALHLTEINLHKHFDRERARFDGSRFLIDMLAIAVPPGRSSARKRAEQQLVAIRQRWKAAPEQWDELLNSLAAEPELLVTRERWLRGSGEMLPALVSPLLAMQAGQLSQPIHTAGSVHLIRLKDMQAGDFELDQVRGDVRTHMLSFLLEYLARHSRDRLPLTAME